VQHGVITQLTLNELEKLKSSEEGSGSLLFGALFVLIPFF
jgi:hypothetical protein